LGKYGRTPGEVNSELLALVEKKTNQKRSEGRQADLLAPRMDKLKDELRKKGFPDTDEMAVLHAMFPQELEKLLKPAPAAPAPAAAPAAPAPAAAVSASSAPISANAKRYSLTVEGRTYGVAVEEVS
jgi:oxaloacetate decarboxylase alpha subunit/pyruvate carboxylase subunit B